MPRNASGTYSLPSGNPVSSGTLIDATWANNTLNDIANEMTDSLSRSGEGGMLAPFRLNDGVQATPGLAFTNEPSTGMYRAGTNEAWLVAGGTQVLQFTTNGAAARFAAGAVGTPSITALGDLNTGLWFPAADTLAASTGGSERLRVDSSGNVGIGTAGPSEKLEVSGTVAGALATRIVNLSSDSAAVTRLAMFTQGGTWNINANRSDFSLAFATNSTERMRLDSSGNLGIGTASPVAKLSVQDASVPKIALQVGGTERAFLSYTESNFTTRLDSDGPLVFAANNAEVGRFDVLGNLGIGTASPGARLHVATAGNNYIASHNTSGSTSALLLGAESGQNTIYSWTTVAGSTGRPLAFYTGPSEVMRLDSSGNLGIGTASPGQKLEVAGNQRFTGSQVGTKIENRQTAVSVTGATTILDDAGSLGRLVVVNGESGSDRFCDLVLCSTGVSPTVVSSYTSLGSPAARTYTRSGSALQLAMASGTYTVTALALGY